MRKVDDLADFRQQFQFQRKQLESPRNDSHDYRR
jgi:hypothetical protein